MDRTLYVVSMPQFLRNYKLLFKTFYIKIKTLCTVKSLIEARAFIRIIPFSREGGGRLLEAVVLAKYV